jgi:hypothetical protein
MKSVDFTGGAKAGEVFNAGFELFDFVLEFLCFWFVDSGELVFETPEARFFALFVDIGFADVLAFVDLVELRLREIGDFECLVDFGGVESSDTFAVNTLTFE